MCAFDWYQNQRLWMTLNGRNALYCRKDASFGAHCTTLNKDRSTLSAAQMQANDSSFWKCKVYADIHGGSFFWAGASNDDLVVDDGNF